MDIIRKTQIASQIIALMGAEFSRPSDEEKEEILDIARIQIQDLKVLRETPEVGVRL